MLENISFTEKKDAIIRCSIIILGLIVVYTLINPVNDEVVHLSKEMNPHIETLSENSNATLDEKLYARDKLSNFYENKVKVDTWRSILFNYQWTFAMTILASLVAVSYSKIRWSEIPDNEPATVKVAKIKTLGVIFAAVFLANALIFIGRF